MRISEPMAATLSSVDLKTQATGGEWTSASPALTSRRSNTGLATTAALIRARASSSPWRTRCGLLFFVSSGFRSLPNFLQDGIKIEGSSNSFTTSGSGTATYKVDGTPLGYNGRYDEHLAPIVEILFSLRQKLINVMRSSEADVQAKQDAMDDQKAKSEEIQKQAVAAAANVIFISVFRFCF
jgi:hypothetical protein